MSKFTKGKWAIDHTDERNGDICVVDASGEVVNYIAELDNIYRDPQEAGANARLIAAAPEMYEELQDALKIMRIYDAYMIGTNKYELSAEADAIEELLARIDGEEMHNSREERK